MQPTLRFFKTSVSDNRNYTLLISGGGYCIKKEDLDDYELRLLNKWFDDYSRTANRTLNVRLEHNTDNGVSYLRSTEIQGEVYTNPELLKNRLQQLYQIEADFFKQIDYIKQPKF